MVFITLSTILGSCQGMSTAITSAEGITMGLFTYILYKDSVHCSQIWLYRYAHPSHRLASDLWPCQSSSKLLIWWFILIVNLNKEIKLWQVYGGVSRSGKLRWGDPFWLWVVPSMGWGKGMNDKKKASWLWMQCDLRSPPLWLFCHSGLYPWTVSQNQPCNANTVHVRHSDTARRQETNTADKAKISCLEDLSLEGYCHCLDVKCLPGAQVLESLVPASVLGAWGTFGRKAWLARAGHGGRCRVLSNHEPKLLLPMSCFY